MIPGLRLIFFLLVCTLSACQRLGQPRPVAPDLLALFPAVPQPSNAALSPDGSQLVFIVGDSLLLASTARPAGGAHLLSTDVSEEASVPIPFVAWSPDSKTVFFRRGMRAGGKTPRYGVPSLVDVGEPGSLRPAFRPTLADSVGTFQNAFASGPQWSPQGDQIAFLAYRTGNSSNALQLQLLNVSTSELKQRTEGPRAVFSVAWSPDGRWLAYTRGQFGRPGSTVEIGGVDSTGALQPRVVADDSAEFLRDLLWSPSGNFLLTQDRTRRTLVLKIGPDLNASVVAHNLPNRKYVGWLQKDSALVTSVPNGMSARLAVISFPSGEVRFLTGRDTLATAIGVASKQSSLIAYSLESGELPADIWMRDLSRAPGLALPTNVTRLTLGNPGLDLSTAQIVRWLSNNGDTLEAQLLLPRSAKNVRAPLVVFPYGGYRNTFPRSDYFLTRGILPLLAEGYAVIFPNTRGTATDNRDMNRYGRIQLDDTESLLDQLGNLAPVDTRRVAVVGHSHGAALAYYYLTHSMRFCAVVAVNGRADWILQANYPGDLLPSVLGGMPAELPDVYRRYSPVANARAAHGALLAVAGMYDIQILPQNAERMADSMRAAGKRVKTLVFVDEGHLLLQPENVRRFWTATLETLASNCRAVDVSKHSN